MRQVCHLATLPPAIEDKIVLALVNAAKVAAMDEEHAYEKYVKAEKVFLDSFAALRQVSHATTHFSSNYTPREIAHRSRDPGVSAFDEVVGNRYWEDV